MRKVFITRALLGLLVALTFSQASHAQVGPGLGNIDCTANDEMKVISEFNNSESFPNGSNVVTMVGGYLLVVWAVDSGRTPGVIELFDVSDPRQPRSVARYDDEDTQRFREQHSIPMAWIGGREYVTFQTVDGVQIWDFTDPIHAKRVSRLDLPGISGGDYDNVAWQATWGGKHIYLAGANQGIYVIDASNPAEPKLDRQVPIGETGGFRVGPIYVQGNSMFISNMDQRGAYATLDVSNPTQPGLLDTFADIPKIYASIMAGDLIYGALRTEGDIIGGVIVHSIADPSNIVEISRVLLNEDTLYTAYQDGFVFGGAQESFRKIDVNSLQEVGSGNLGKDHPDHGQVTPLGNLMYVGNDHTTGSALFCTHVGTDTTAPQVLSTYPKDLSVGLSQGSRIGISFSDFIDFHTVNSSTVIVKPSGGEAIEGIYSYVFNTLNFEPTTPFTEDTTYEVVLPVGGVRDVTGNLLTEEVKVTFSTGTEIKVILPELPEEEPEPEVPEPSQPEAPIPGTGGSMGGIVEMPPATTITSEKSGCSVGVPNGGATPWTLLMGALGTMLLVLGRRNSRAKE